MEYQKILELWDRFECSNATEMVLDFQGTHFSLKKEGLCLSKGSAHEDAIVAEHSETAHSVKVKNEEENLIPIKAPLVGTFYAAPSPDADPFVSVGKEVKKGDVIGIIEAMKLMNELTASEDGIVKEILVSDGDFVAFDQPLILLAGR